MYVIVSKNEVEGAIRHDTSGYFRCTIYHQIRTFLQDVCVSENK